MNNLESNATQAYEEFMKLTIFEMGSAMKSGMKAALNRIVKMARQSLRSLHRGTDLVKPPYTESVEQGIRRSKVFIEQDGVVWGTIRAHSKRKRGSKAYILPMLDKGTQPRYVKTYRGRPLKKPAYRGEIHGSRFFTSTTQAAQSTFYQLVMTELDKAVKKINSKK